MNRNVEIQEEDLKEILDFKETFKLKKEDSIDIDDIVHIILPSERYGLEVLYNCKVEEMTIQKTRKQPGQNYFKNSMLSEDEKKKNKHCYIKVSSPTGKNVTIEDIQAFKNYKNLFVKFFLLSSILIEESEKKVANKTIKKEDSTTIEKLSEEFVENIPF